MSFALVRTRTFGRSLCIPEENALPGTGFDDDIFEEIQYEALNSILNLLKNEYSIPDKNIVGHQHVAPERKTDPGPNFDWSKINAGHLDR